MSKHPTPPQSQLLAFLVAGWLLLLLGGASRSASVLALDPQQSVMTVTPTAAALTGCAPQGEIVTKPIVDSARICPRYLVRESPVSALPGITAITYAPACNASASDPVWCGRLFFVRPESGTVEWVGQFDPAAGTFPLHTFANGLDTPNGLAWHAGSLYVSGGTHIYRLQDQDGDGLADVSVILIDSLPAGPGAWPGSIVIGSDSRLYVTIGASCNACIEPDSRRATLLSFALDGTDERIEARGLGNAYDFAWHPETGDLYAADSERDGRGPLEPLDEINLIETGGHYGWPYCYETATGTVADAALASPEDFCQTVARPAFTLPAHSAPAGMAFYTGAAFPEYQDDLLVALAGESDSRRPQGYAIYRVCLDSQGEPELCLDASGKPIPDAAGNPHSGEILLPVDSFYGYGLDIMTLQGQGFYPEHPVDIAISPEGYIAISLAEGRIIELLPVTATNSQP